MKKQNTRLKVKSVKGKKNSIFEVIVSSKKLLTPPIHEETPIRFRWMPTSENFMEAINRLNNKLIEDYLNETNKSKDDLTKESIDYEKNDFLKNLLKCKEFLNIVNRAPKTIAVIKQAKRVNPKSDIIEVVVENLSTFDNFVREKELDVEIFPEERRNSYNITNFKDSDAFMKEFKKSLISEVDFDLPENFDLKALFRKIKKESSSNSNSNTFLHLFLIASLLFGSFMMWNKFYPKESDNSVSDTNTPSIVNSVSDTNTPSTVNSGSDTNTTSTVTPPPTIDNNHKEWLSRRVAFLNCLKKVTNDKSIKVDIDIQIEFTRGLNSKYDELLDGQEQEIIDKISPENNIDLNDCLAKR